MIDKHFTATTYLLDTTSKSTLLHWHKKIQTWLPPGGHIEQNENPEEAARREIQEETGIVNIEFIPNQKDKPKRIDNRSILLNLPHFLLEEEIEFNHYHLDWIFFAWVIRESEELEYNETKFKWFRIEELKSENEIFENVKFLALKGLKEYCV
ncbi:MAG: RNA pyrophosphohydrolase [Candidatus Heimdallarchaeota archaeon LC_2]|nr:MAG: RNA pyrophosphohydrolase [Candidatus Heimdallarchaeota archaeon LC_2]